MIREYAPSLNNRGHFLDEIKVFKMRGGRDKFMSLFCYDESVKEYVKEKGKIAGYKGIIYLSGEHIIDVDGNEFNEAKEKADRERREKRRKRREERRKRIEERKKRLAAKKKRDAEKKAKYKKPEEEDLDAIFG